MTDSYHLQRFLDAQAPIYRSALAELGAGAKRGHWMWFIFPQIRGLGSSPTAVLYAIGSSAEAEAYLLHPVLGPRLHECTAAILSAARRTAVQIFGDIDALKLRSSLTLFANMSSAQPIFQEALERFFAGEHDRATLDRLYRDSEH